MMLHRSISACCLLLCCSFSHADDLFDLSIEELQNIKIEVASLFEDNALDAASSTSTLTTNDWQKRGTHTLGHTLESVPSVMYSQTWGGTEVLAIRGYATELSVRGLSYSLDGIPLGTYVYANTGYMLSKFPLSLMQQVEMIRGPGSTVYGSDAFHGVMSFKLAKAPVNQSQAYLVLGDQRSEVSLTNSHYFNEWQVHSGFAYEDIQYNISDYQYTDPTDGSTKTSQRSPTIENLSAYLKAEKGQLNAGGKFSTLLFYNQYAGKDFQGIGRQFFVPIGEVFDLESLSLSTFADHSDNLSQFMLAGITHDIKLTDSLELSNKLYAWQSEQEWLYNNRGYLDNLTLRSDLGATLDCKTEESHVTGNPLYCPHDRSQLANERRMGYQVLLKQKNQLFNTRWAIGAGIDEIKVIDSHYSRTDTNGNVMLANDTEYNGDVRRLTHLLAQARTGLLNDKLLISYGIRWDDYSDASSHLSPRLGVVHKLSPNWRQKFLYGHAYRAPTANEMSGASSSVIANPDLKAETIDTFEYVLMYQQPDISVEAVLFESNWHDAIALKPISNLGSTNQYQNINRNHAQGIELSINKQIHNWNVKWVNSYTHSRSVSEEKDYQAFPSYMSSLNIEHKSLNQKTIFGSWYRYMQDYALGDDHSLFSERNETYQRLDLYAYWKLSKETQIGLHIQNLFDDNLTLPSYYGSEGGWQDMSRNVSISLQQNF